MNRRVLNGSRMKSHQIGCDRQLAQRRDTTNLAAARTSWFWKHFNLIHFSILWLKLNYCWFVLIYPILLVDSVVNVEILSTRNKKHQNKKLFNQLSEKSTDYSIGQSNQKEQTEITYNMICRGNPSDNASNPTQINYPQVNVQTLEEIILIVKCELTWTMCWHQSKLESKKRYLLQNN